MFEYKMPKMDHMTEDALIAKWMVSEGDYVELGDIIMQIETGKAVLEVEANFSGKVSKILVPEGVEVPVLSVIAWVETQ